MKELILKTLLLALAPSTLLMFDQSANRSSGVCEYNNDCAVGMLCVYESEESDAGICIAAIDVPDDAIIGWNPGQGGGSTGGSGAGDRCEMDADCAQGFVCRSNGKYLDCLPPL